MTALDQAFLVYLSCPYPKSVNHNRSLENPGPTSPRQFLEKATQCLLIQAGLQKVLRGEGSRVRTRTGSRPGGW